MPILHMCLSRVQAAVCTPVCLSVQATVCTSVCPVSRQRSVPLSVCLCRRRSVPRSVPCPGSGLYLCLSRVQAASCTPVCLSRWRSVPLSVCAGGALYPCLSVCAGGGPRGDSDAADPQPAPQAAGGASGDDAPRPVQRACLPQGDRHRRLQDLRPLGEARREPEPRRTLRQHAQERPEGLRQLMIRSPQPDRTTAMTAVTRGYQPDQTTADDSRHPQLSV